MNIGNRAKETTTTTGTGTYSLAGAASSKYQTLVAAVLETMGGSSPWSRVPYVVSDGTDFEIGLGTLTDAATDTLSRDTIIESSNGGAAVNWGAGTRDVIIALPAQRMFEANAAYMGIQANCRLVQTNATTLTLQRFNGKSVPFIDGAGNVYYLQLDSQPTLANTGLAASTLYYIYAYDSAGTITLEASTTAYTSHASGLKTETGDATRTLVGMIRTEGSTPGQFVDSVTQRFTRSWFNEAQIELWRSGTDGQTTTSATPAEHNSARRLEFIIFSGEIVKVEWGGQYRNDDPASDMEVSIGVDGTTSQSGSERVAAQHATASEYFPFHTKAVVSSLAAGYHYATLLHRRITAAGTVSTTSAGGAVTLSGPRG